MSVYTWKIERFDEWPFRYVATIEASYGLTVLKVNVFVTRWGAERWIARIEKQIRAQEARPVARGSFEVKKDVS